MTARPGSSGAGTQTLAWDAEGHLSSAVDGANTFNYVYDADGNRLIAKDSGGTTLFLGINELRLRNGQISVTRSIGGVAVRTSSGVTWSIADHQGTDNLTVNAADQTVNARWQTPYGQPRGAVPPNWVDSRGFVGGTVDPTGLTHLGAREYDPAIGRFISADPIVDPHDPQQMQGYAYAELHWAARLRIGPDSWKPDMGQRNDGGILLETAEGNKGATETMDAGVWACAFLG